jgi:hypothetical protein
MTVTEKIATRKHGSFKKGEELVIRDRDFVEKALREIRAWEICGA